MKLFTDVVYSTALQVSYEGGSWELLEMRELNEALLLDKG